MEFLYVKVIFVAVITILAFTYGQSNPIHASCRISWSLPAVTCPDFAKKIVTQANTWQTSDNCKGGGERCLYKITSQSATEIKATHTTPVKHYVDDLTFTMSTIGSGCRVAGFSTSETWYAYLDAGTNYCNLNNLITGAGLNSTRGYTETTSDSVCTQYTSRNCDKY